MKRVLAAFFIAATCSGLALAGFDEGKKAYDAEDYATALKEWQPLAEQGDARAQAQLAQLYFHGAGVPKNLTKARDLARAAAEQGDAHGQHLFATLLRNGGDGIERDIPQSIAWLRKAADQGLSEAQADLGIAYWNGKGLAKNRAEAEIWLRRAAEQGNAKAAYSLGLACMDREPSDFAGAATWYRKASIEGHAGAQLFLGVMYGEKRAAAESGDTGDEVFWNGLSEALPRDLVLAYVFLTLADRGGAMEAPIWLDKLGAEMSPAQIAEGDAILTNWEPGQDLPITSKTGAVLSVVP